MDRAVEDMDVDVAGALVEDCSCYLGEHQLQPIQRTDQSCKLDLHRLHRQSYKR